MKRMLLACCVFATIAVNAQHQLTDFYKYDAEVEHQVDQLFQSLNDTQRVAQMLVVAAGELGKPDDVVKQLVKDNKVGGVVVLKGTKEAHSKLLSDLAAIAEDQSQLPLLNSIDAEPSLFNGRVKGTAPMMKTIDIKSVETCDSVVHVIDKHLIDMGIYQNFAPVADISPSNAAIKNRSFGNDRDTLITLSTAFIKATQADGIVATAKHFPGHGLVVGDTHKQSVYIDGPLQEVDIYKPLIAADVVSIMVAHITVKNNEKYGTDGLPSTCSRTIVTDLLKEEMGFKGLIITDALNIMKAVTILDNAPLLASKAGCDVLLMPKDEQVVIDSILAEMAKDEAYRTQVYASVKKIIRVKIFTGLIK